MNDSESNAEPDLPAQSDSRLKSFLRQSAGIIAGEKGMTPACQRKLQALAEQIKLPPDIFDQAIAQLRGSQLDVEQLTRYEAAFLTFLKSEIEKLDGDVMSPRMEKAAIDIARDKYQIKSSIAQRLIEEQCEAMNISRVSHDEAQEFAKQAILKQLSDHVYIDAELQAQLYRIGKNWGLDRLAVDQITIPTIAENRNRKVGQSSKVTPLTIVLLGLLGIALVGYYTWPKPVEQVGGPNPTQTAEGPTVGPGSEGSNASERPTSPAAQQLAKLSEVHPSVRQTLERFLRTVAPDQLTTTISTEPNQQNESSNETDLPNPQSAPFSSLQLASQTLTATLAEPLWCDEPKYEAATLQWLSDVIAPLPADTKRMIHAELVQALNDLNVSSERALPLERVLRINRATLAIIVDNLNNEEKRQANQPLIAFPSWYREALFHPVDAPLADGIKGANDPKTKTEAAIVNEQWNRFVAFAFAKPEHASTLLPDLIRGSEPRIAKSQLERWKRDTVLSLADNIKNWSPRFIELCRAELNSLQPIDGERTLRWALVLVKQAQQDYFESLAQTLIAAVEISQSDAGRQTSKATLDNYIAINQYREFKPLLNRVNRIAENTENRLNAKSLNDQQLPEQIANVAIAVNLELELLRAIKLAEIGPEQLQAIDRQLENANPSLREQIILRYARPTDRTNDLDSSVSLQATASDIRHKENALEKINSQENETSVEFQLLALRQLSRVALRFPDLRYAECQTFVEFFLSGLPGKQQLELQQLLTSYSHWPTIGLALADSIETTDASMDLALTTARLLMRHDFEIENADNWRQELRLEILTLANDDLAVRIANDPTNESADWTRLKLFLTGVLLERLRLVSQGDSFSQPDTDSVFELAVKVAETSTRRLNLAPLVRALSQNELDQLAILNQLILMERTPAAPPRLEALSDADNFGRRLWESERLLLRTFQQKREMAIKQFLELQAIQ